MGDLAEGLRAHLDLLRGVYSDLSAIEGKTDKDKYANLDGKAFYNQLATFLKAGFEAAIMVKPIARDRLDPLRDDVLRTVDTYRQEWGELVNARATRCGLACPGFWHYGTSPSWSVSFAAGCSKPLAILTLSSNIVFIEFTLPIGAMDTVALGCD